MDSLYQNYSTTDFHRKAQGIASNIQKITQNGIAFTFMFRFIVNVFYVCISRIFSVINYKNGWPDWISGTRLIPGITKSTVSN